MTKVFEITVAERHVWRFDTKPEAVTAIYVEGNLAIYVGAGSVDTALSLSFSLSLAAKW